MKGKAGIALLLIAAIASTLTAASTAATDAARGPQGQAAADRTLLRCGTRVRVGIAAPITGQVASLGSQQLGWAQFFVSRWNRFHKLKVTLVQGDTQLPDTAAALRAATQLAGNSQVLGVVGPAGSQEVIVSSPPFKSRGVGFISGSATRTTLTQEPIRRGFFFRVVPPDSVQSTSVANYIAGTLKAQRVFVIDDQEAYGVGLSNETQTKLRAKNVTVTRDSVNVGQVSDFSSLVAKIPTNTQVVYIPWQIAAKGQLFGQQLREQGKQATVFGSDGLFDPSSFKLTGAYLSFFPVARTSPLITAYRSAHGGDAEYFGAPTYAATQVVVNAIDRACKNGTATRAEVRAQIKRTDIPASASVLGLRIRFAANGDIRGGRFGIFRVASNGAYLPVG